MSDLAVLGMRFETKGADTAARQMDAVAQGAARAEAATDGMSGAGRRAGSAIAQMVASIDRTLKQLVELSRLQQQAAGATSAHATATSQLAVETTQAAAAVSFYGASFKTTQSSMGGAAAAARDFATAATTAGSATVQMDAYVLAYQANLRRMNAALPVASKQMRDTQMAALGLSRQFADIGVTAAMGMNPLMIILQQGPQIADQLAMMKMQGIGLSAAMRGLWVSMAPFIAVLAPFAAAAALAAASFGLLHRELSKGYPKNVTDGLGLTAEQLKRVEDKTVTFGDTFKATFTVIGRHIMDSPIGAALKAIGETSGNVMDWIAKKWVDGWAIQMGIAVGTLKTIVQNWKLFPALMGEIMAATTNIFTRAMETMVNRHIDGFNLIGKASNLLFRTSFDPIAHLDLPEVENRFAGTAANMGESLRRNVSVEIGNARAALVSLGKEIGDEALANAVKRALEQAGGANRGREAGKSDLEKSIEETLRYIQALKDQAATFGLNAIAAKEYEIGQKAQAAATTELRAEVLKHGSALLDKMRIEAAGVKPMQDQLELLEKELGLVGASNRARMVEIALLAKRQQMSTAGVPEGSDAWNKGLDGALSIAEAQDDLASATFAANDAITYQLDLLTQLDDRARDASLGMAEAFGSAVRALGDLLSLTTNYGRQQEEIYVRRSELLKQAGLDEKAIARIIVRSNEESAAAQVAYYGDVLSAAKNVFGEQTGAFKALQAAEMAYRTVQFAMAAKSVAINAWETAQNIPRYIAQAVAAASAGAAKMFASLGPLGFAAVAAMGVTLAAFGLRSLGGGGGGAPAALPDTNTGTGTVLGDPTAQSQSINKSMELAEKYYNRDLAYSNDMLDALRAIERGIGDVTTAIARQLGVGGKLSTDGLGLGSTSNPGFLGMFSSTRSSSLADQGLNFGGQSLGQIIENGIAGSFFQIVQNSKTKSGFFGIGGGTTTWNTETSSGIDGGLSRDIANLLASLKDGVLSAAGVLGLEGAEAVLNAFQVNIGRISFKDMSSAEIAETLTAVFSAVGDQMAGAIMPTLTRYQQAGEGLMETLTRLAAQYQAVDQVMASLGMTFSAVGVGSIEARDRLVQLSGGLEEFVKSSTFFAEEFLTEAQRMTPIQSAVNAELTRLGLSTSMTREQFASVVTGLDVSTQAGAKMYAALMALAPAFAKVIGYTEDLAEANNAAAEAAAQAAAQLLGQHRSLEIELMEATGNAAGALAARRADELAALDASLRPIKEAIWAARDLAAAQAEAARAAEEAARAYDQQRQAALALVDTARNNLTQAYQREASALQQTIDKFGGFSESLRAFRKDLEGGASETSFDAIRAEFQRVAALARLGNEDALGSLQGVSQSYLGAAMLNAGSALEYQRAVGSVIGAVDAAIGTSDRQKSLAEQQLDTLKSQVRGLIDLNESVLSVHDAIIALQAAMRGAGRYGVTEFAVGGVFTSPTSFAMGSSLGVMAEAGPEAIMPLVQTGGGLGVRAVNDNADETAAEVRALRAEVAELRTAMVQVAVNTGQTARQLQRQEVDGLYVRGEVPGDPVEVEIAA